MRKTFLFALFAFPMALQAQGLPSSCWELSDMQGIAMAQSDGYAPQSDRISSSLVLRLNGNASSASGSDIRLMQVDSHMAVGLSIGDTFTTVETYQVDPTLGIALYTKAMSAKSIMSGLTGTRSFVGQAARCSSGADE